MIDDACGDDRGLSPEERKRQASAILQELLAVERDESWLV